jgi:hypothetical protein
VGALLARTPVPAADLDLPAVPLTLFATGLGVALLAGWALHRRLTARAVTARAETWACGYGETTTRMQYTASSFASPLLIAFKTVAGVHTARAPDALSTHATDPVLGSVLLPAWRGVGMAAARMRPLQRGRLSAYLGYLATTLVALLLYLLLAGGSP